MRAKATNADQLHAFADDGPAIRGNDARFRSAGLARRDRPRCRDCRLARECPWNRRSPRRDRRTGAARLHPAPVRGLAVHPLQVRCADRYVADHVSRRRRTAVAQVRGTGTRDGGGRGHRTLRVQRRHVRRGGGADRVVRRRRARGSCDQPAGGFGQFPPAAQRRLRTRRGRPRPRRAEPQLRRTRSEPALGDAVGADAGDRRQAALQV